MYNGYKTGWFWWILFSNDLHCCITGGKLKWTPSMKIKPVYIVLADGILICVIWKGKKGDKFGNKTQIKFNFFEFVFK